MLANFPPSYAYLEYNDDENIQALISAFNLYAAAYIFALNSLNLPIYTNLPTSATLLTIVENGAYDSVLNNSLPLNQSGSDSVGGSSVVGLLAWVLTGLYGITRPTLGALVSSKSVEDAYNTYRYNTRQYNEHVLTKTYNYSVASDDIYKRVATWNLYKGDGYQFTARWLKRRAVRFLTGANGIDPGVQETYGVGVTYGANYAITINCNHLYPGASFIPALTELIASGALQLPFQYDFTVVTV
jgi:hypothetical protein